MPSDMALPSPLSWEPTVRFLSLAQDLGYLALAHQQYFIKYDKHLSALMLTTVGRSQHRYLTLHLISCNFRFLSKEAVCTPSSSLSLLHVPVPLLDDCADEGLGFCLSVFPVSSFSTKLCQPPLKCAHCRIQGKRDSRDAKPRVELGPLLRAAAIKHA